jgi:hypothetical protein
MGAPACGPQDAGTFGDSPTKSARHAARCMQGTHDMLPFKFKNDLIAIQQSWDHDTRQLGAPARCLY